MQVNVLDRIADIDANVWNSLAGDGYPFLRHEFLLALEQSGCVALASGWIPKHLLLVDGDEAIAIMPLYLKTHSRGEYVFDHQWANAYQQHGLHYYPKFLTAIPFTPCQGPRFACKSDVDVNVILSLFVNIIQEIANQQGISSWHCLFPTHSQLSAFQENTSLLIREGVQFQWFNKNYSDFDAFLQTLTAQKRKMIKRERRRISEQGLELRQLRGTEISKEDWRTFYQFYVLTYFKKGSSPYLNLTFFEQIARTMPEQLWLVLALKDNQPVAASLSFIGNETLYGRYWGCHEEYNSLHFETCYYQGIDFCIKHQLTRFDSGAQGEHKIARGFEPVTTYSAHWIKDNEFSVAIADFLRQEQLAIKHYKTEAATYLPYKKCNTHN